MALVPSGKHQARARRAVVQSAIVAVLTTLTMTHAAAQFLSADDLHAWCKGNRSMASAYAAGMADEAAHIGPAMKRPMSITRTPLSTMIDRPRCLGPPAWDSK